MAHASAAAPARAVLPPAEQVTRIAAIDIGSNSIRQIVADVSAGGIIRVVDEMKAAPRLAAGLARTGELGAEAMVAALEALGRMATLARQLGAERVEAVATSAVRDAANGRTFRALVRRETGLDVRVLDGTEEARLSFLSALAHFELGAGRAVVMDIGGGSVELTLSADGLLDRLASFPLGAVRLTEEFGDGHGGVRVKKLRKHVREGLRAGMPVRDWRGALVIGSGGTFTNLAGIHLARQGVLTAHSVHATRLGRAEVEKLLDWLSELTPEERLSVPGLNAHRADIIVAGVAIAAQVLAKFEARELVVSRYGIREGLLLDVARVIPAVADPGEARARSVLEFAERCHYEAPHARQVRTLALQLFDAIGERLGCVPADRQALADAALLHDVGYHINYQKHHKHSYHLILHADLLGIAPSEQVVIANVARYHRGAPPKRKHRNYGALDKSLRTRIKRLAAILRVADGLDRGHVAAVARIKVRWLRRALRITPVPAHRAPMRLEMWGGSRKSGLLAEVIRAPVEIVMPDGAILSSDDESTATPEGAASEVE
ncbi:MAG TPA: Ppx/GppA phosphatase family protein [Gemmatimonadaceae bacterium]|nr:Ppx/GppA phosphatase family protein [Gemmatimonadaceae bacterium]